jgi:hypothetical protein
MNVPVKVNYVLIKDNQFFDGTQRYGVPAPSLTLTH